MNQPLRFLGLLLPVLLLAVIAGCIDINDYWGKEKQTEFKPIPRFESYEQLAKAFKLSREQYRQYGIAESALRLPGIVSAPMTGAAARQSAAEGTAPDFSRTNVQVEGVDEADIVKTDGKYIYTLSSQNLVIADVFPVENARIVSKTSMENVYPEEMFVFGDKLLVFGRKKTAYFSMPRPYYSSGMVSVLLFDVSDKSNPVLEKEIGIEGIYSTSRLIGKHAYFVVNSQPRYYWDGPIPLAGDTNSKSNQENIIPVMIENGVEKRIAVPEEIGYLPPVPLNNFLTIASLNLESGEMQKETIVGNAENVFASQDSIFVASTAWLPPETPVVQDIERIVVGDKEKTVVTKFGLKEGKIGFVGQGIVPGHVLNQFSMDEFENNFRIATTAGEVWNEAQPSVNNLYVLDAEMNVIGRLEDLAPGEKIYSARFMGSKAYLVTFKKVDPLFVIDVSNPREPKVLGKLKIPGYSDYLHPFDETHIIGVGKETIESKQGNFAWYQGMKLAIFDVSDVSNPIELHKLTIGDRGTDSYALQDHKAFLFDREKQLLVIPVLLAEISRKDKENPQYGFGSPAYGEPVFQGAFVYNVSLENGFVEKGRITHVSQEEELKRGYYFSEFSNVKRALYIGSVLYTVSESMIKANDLASLQELKQLVLQEKDELYPIPSETITR